MKNILNKYVNSTNTVKVRGKNICERKVNLTTGQASVLSGHVLPPSMA